MNVTIFNSQESLCMIGGQHSQSQHQNSELELHQTSTSGQCNVSCKIWTSIIDGHKSSLKDYMTQNYTGIIMCHYYFINFMNENKKKTWWVFIITNERKDSCWNKLHEDIHAAFHQEIPKTSDTSTNMWLKNCLSVSLLTRYIRLYYAFILIDLDSSNRMIHLYRNVRTPHYTLMSIN